jgi:hypothetical protein
MIPQRRATVPGHALLGLALLSALYSGCQGVEPRPSYVSCYEHDGMWCANYELSFEGARLATLAALTELKMPVYRDGRHRNGIFIDTRTPENLEARIVILPQDRLAEGTRICIGVGGFGTHREVCKRLLDVIARHLDTGRHYLDAVPIHNPVPLVATPGSRPLPAAPPPQSQSSESSMPPQPVPAEHQ